MKKFRFDLQVIICLLAPVAAVVIGLGLSMAVFITFALARTIGTGKPVDQNQANDLVFQLAENPLGLFALLLPGQLAFLAIGVIAAIFFSQRKSTALERLGFVRGHAPIYSWVFYILATPAINVCLILFLTPILPENSAAMEFAERLTQMYTGWSVIFLILGIAVTPGICEEVFFRGFCQRHLTKAWPPWIGILVVSIIFGIVHLDPAQSLAVIPLGIWFGILCWRTGSIWPAIICHFFNNAFAILLPSFGIEETESPQLLVVGAMSGIFLIPSLYFLFRFSPDKAEQSVAAKVYGDDQAEITFIESDES